MRATSPSPSPLPSSPGVTGQWGIFFFRASFLVGGISSGGVALMTEAHANEALWFLLTNACRESPEFSSLWVSEAIRCDPAPCGLVLPRDCSPWRRSTHFTLFLGSYAYLYICLVGWNVRVDIIHEAMHSKRLHCVVLVVFMM